MTRISEQKARLIDEACHDLRTYTYLDIYEYLHDPDKYYWQKYRKQGLPTKRQCWHYISKSHPKSIISENRTNTTLTIYIYEVE